jgi:Secretion system C-terminal sorting domain/Putative Ig domain
MMSRIFTTAACCMLLFLGASGARAEVPFPPADLAVTVSVDDDGAYSAVFTWHRPRGANGVNWRVDGYTLYARDLTRDGSEFVEIATTTELTATIADEVNLCCSAYTYYVKAYNTDGEGDPSNLVSTVGARGYNEGDFGEYMGTGQSEIVSNPPPKALLDKEYRYDAMVLSDLRDRNANITFSVTSGPSGMAIDPATGVITWTPSEPGRYDVRIKAELEESAEMHEQSWTVDVASVASSVPVMTRASDAIYPNPATGELTVRLDAGPASDLRVVDLHGRAVLGTSVPAGAESYRLDVRSLAAGIYFLRIRSSAGEKVAPFSIVR